MVAGSEELSDSGGGGEIILGTIFTEARKSKNPFHISADLFILSEAEGRPVVLGKTQKTLFT